MFQIVSAEKAVSVIKDGDCIGINSFLALANPPALHRALAQRVSSSGSPNRLSLFCSAGFGGWDSSLFAEPYVAAGAVKKVVASHYASMPVVCEKIKNNEIEAYCLPLGVLSHCVRAAAAGNSRHFSKVGLNIFVDPRISGAGLNERSKEQLVKVVEIDGEEYLSYVTPKIDVAFIKGTTVDPLGNITFEDENLTVDALALAQAAKANGGTVLVQVSRVSHLFSRPRNVVVPGALVDYVVVDGVPIDLQITSPILSGDIHVPPTQMDYWMNKLRVSGKRGKKDGDVASELIGKRAAEELTQGDIVNIGIGIPEKVGKYASRLGILKDIVLTVEAGGIGGVPAPGVSFGATIGADMICDMATQFDFYDGGGLDICFMGGIEADMHGNVNSHKMKDKFVGIGGFANITLAAKKIVFCLNFTALGLEAASMADGRISITHEGSVKKFKREIDAISFSAKNALKRGQEVLYVTERCVFRLTEKGLALQEVFDGIDEKTQIRDLLDFEIH